MYLFPLEVNGPLIFFLSIQVYICHGCFVADHKDHVVQDAEDVMKREHYREKLRENVKHLEKMKQDVCEVERAQNVEELERAETVAITRITKQVSTEDITPFVGPLVPQLWTFWDIYPGIQRHEGSLLACFVTWRSLGSPLVHHLLALDGEH